LPASENRIALLEADFDDDRLIGASSGESVR